MHYEDSQWVNVTVLPIDVVNNVICARVSSLSPFAVVEPPCCQIRGDFDHNGAMDIADIDNFIDWLYKSGVGPYCYDETDADNSTEANAADIDYLILYLFGGGPAPVPCP